MRWGLHQLCLISKLELKLPLKIPPWRLEGRCRSEVVRAAEGRLPVGLSLQPPAPI